MRLGVTGGDVWQAVTDVLEDEGFGNSLNPGRHTHLDEWVHTPFRRDSRDALSSGMALQCDIIPTGIREGWTANCEDGLALTDEALRDEIAAKHPQVWARILARRAFMRAQLGIDVADEVLSLSNIAACFMPFWLSPDRMLVAG